MEFSLNDFLMSVSFALDFVEMDRFGMRTNHGKRTAYISLSMGKGLGLSKEELFDVAALALLHDNGLSESSLYEQLGAKGALAAEKFESSKGHCLIGERNVKDYPFLTRPKNVILYHHERFDGSGFFKLSGNEIPLMAQIISAADSFEKQFGPAEGAGMEEEILQWTARCEGRIFSPDIARVFRDMAGRASFLNSLADSKIESALTASVPPFCRELPFEQIQHITGILSRIIDSKSSFTQRHSQGLSEKAAKMAGYYGKGKEETIKLIIAADLHDLGKLAVPNSILDSPRALTEEEFQLVKKHVYYTRIALQNIRGFEDITEWAANHHEKLDGSGYPFGKTGADLDFNSRLLGCLDMYQALTEERPYRDGMNHGEAMRVLFNMEKTGLIDSRITEEINEVFAVTP
ncbi:HD domain-containing phosphohydrolase [Lachnospiraceae bacterium 54-53]